MNTADKPRERIGLVGVERMGADIARRIQACGFPITSVYDPRRRIAQTLASELGCEAPRSLAKVTACADIILTAAADDEAMLGYYARHGDSLLIGAEGRLFVNCATVSPETHAKVEENAALAGADVMEACLTPCGSSPATGLYILCGGPAEAFERAAPLLRRLARVVRYIGDTGSAAKLKLIIHMIAMANTAILAEGLALAEAVGLDLGLVREICAQTVAASRVLETDGERMQQRQHEDGFRTDMAAREIALAVRMARKMRLELPVATATKRQYDRMLKAGMGDLDKSGIAELTFRERGVVLQR
ncbi:MAG: NAD(P)-dependent oxidoreductase [Verrucomicrobia bacterium]|nr:MAG: NAD(P)-dependent oxidoreductase [Verrucomicrobiota bacterium]